MESDFKEKDAQFSCSDKVKDYCRLQLALEPDEIFSILFLDNNNKLIEFNKMFRGTVNQSNVFLRPIVRKALELNASKVIFSHNHPSGNCKPSEEDIIITEEFTKFLKQIDIQVLDHIVVSQVDAVSMKEKFLI